MSKTNTANRYSTQINVRLDAELKEQLDREVRLRRTTQSQLIRDAVVRYLKHLSNEAPGY